MNAIICGFRFLGSDCLFPRVSLSAMSCYQKSSGFRCYLIGEVQAPQRAGDELNLTDIANCILHLLRSTGVSLHESSHVSYADQHAPDQQGGLFSRNTVIQDVHITAPHTPRAPQTADRSKSSRINPKAPAPFVSTPLFSRINGVYRRFHLLSPIILPVTPISCLVSVPPIN
jgi:hypothetical protein